MAKWLCSCGQQLRSSGDIPNPHEWLIISDVDYAAFTGQVNAEDVYMATKSVFRCPRCDRLHVFWSESDGPPTVYRQDEAT